MVLFSQDALRRTLPALTTMSVVAAATLAVLVSTATASASASASADHRPSRHVGEAEVHNHNHALGGSHNQLDADDPDFTGVVDFSNAIPGPGGSWCITKTKYVEHMVKDQIKECWHQNVTQCHDTYVTEFLPSQEQKCEESFWKSCKIDFREMPFNYTMKQCHTPLRKMCDPSPSYGKPKIVCKTWFESECNTTFTETTPNVEDKPSTWCKKVPRKICAPDNCRMVNGPEECNDKTLVSTVQKPTEICDLQPQQHCRLITKLTPHLISKEVCKNIPKEVCHLALSGPKMVRKPITLKWCTRDKGEFKQHGGRLPQQQQIPSYQPRQDYLPPPPPGRQQGSASSPPPPPPNFSPPTYSSSPRPNSGFRQPDDIDAFASENVKVTKFPPPGVKKYYKAVESNPNKKRSSSSNNDFKQPVFQEQFKPSAAIRSPAIQIPESFKQAVREAGLLEELELEKRGFRLVEAREEGGEDISDHLVDVVEDEVDEELLDELLARPARLAAAAAAPVSISDALDGGLGGEGVLGGGVGGGHGVAFGLKRRRRR